MADAVARFASQLARTDLRGTSVRFLLDFTLAGRTYHLAEQDTVAPIGPGSADVYYVSGLEWGGALADRIALFKDDPDGKSVDLTLNLYPTVDVAQLVEQGHVLGAATGTLYAWIEGTSSVLTLLSGRFRDPSWDEPPAPLVGTLEEDPAQDPAVWPPASHRITDETWPSADEAVKGERYPMVFGSPGRADIQQDATPGLICDTAALTRWLLIAGHHVLATQVRVVNTSTMSGVYATVVNGYDGLDQPIAYVSLVGTGIYAAGDSYWIRWYNSTGTPQQAHPGDDGNGLQTAGALLLWWLRRSGIRWDTGRTYAAADMLRGYTLDGYAMGDPDAQIVPYHWIQDNLLPILPVSARIGPKGWYPVVWAWNADPTAATVRLVEGENCTALEGVETTAMDDVAGSVSLSYAYDGNADETLKRLALSGDTTGEDGDDDAQRSAVLIRARQQYGQMPGITLSSVIVQDDETAARVLAWYAHRSGAQHYIAGYAADQEIGLTLTPGTSVLLTHQERGWTTRHALVESVLWTGDGQPEVVLVIPALDMGTPA